MNKYFIGGLIIWSIVFLCFFTIRKSSKIHTILLNMNNKKQKIMIAVVFIILTLLCTIPMSWSPKYNGEESTYRNEYEVMADSILDGHLYMNREVDEKLLQMDNPYDPIERENQEIEFYWDHAFYNGHYYMYFGIVPVFILFIPYKLITGETLVTYHATQIFVALIIMCFFLMFAKLSSKFFKKMTFGMYLLLSISLSVLSVYYIVDAPTLYCTAIASGICMEMWSIYFYLDVLYFLNSKKFRVIKIFIAALLGALAFGCRPPIALANIIVIPFIIQYIKENGNIRHNIKEIIALIIPYIIIGILLMLYNYLRFDNPFEFGQSYQLTADDQRNISNILERCDYNPIKLIITFINGLGTYFISFNGFSYDFPFVKFNGVYFNFPVLFSSVLIFKGNIKNILKDNKLFYISLCLFILPIIISISNIIWCPVIIERYKLDFYFIISIVSFIAIGFYNETVDKKNLSLIVCLVCLLTFFYSILLFLVPNDKNFVIYYNCAYEIFRYFIFGLSL